ncbi:MAG: type II toxin-antitoxin system VapC family toxin [Clostridia bacterium]|nr:type II toxin-antitoxin system VapC family toxin [Clostridia bacterium]MDH7573859.1 type II toxin-antitoxin system VapC family toxin [Clostridia bacterium]
MICYLDTSALVKLYVLEPGSEAVRRLVGEAAVAATSIVAYPEARAALARGLRDGLLDEKDYRQVVAALESDWPRYLALEVSDSLARFAGELAEKHRLRGFDAIHLASALTLKVRVKDRVVAGCFDERLWEALRAVDLEVLPGR